MASSVRSASEMLVVALLLHGLGLASGRLLMRRRAAPELNGAAGRRAQACTELVNRGTHFAIDIEVGTPGQKFSVVADTGSNTLIVPSCLCQHAGGCGKSDRCFTGTNRSSSFSLIKGTQGPKSLLITFGSGQVQGVLARETVRIGQLEANMSDGILLMTAKALRFGGPFEGILGLGIPRKEEQPAEPSRTAAAHRSPAVASPGIREIMPHGTPTVASAGIREIMQKIVDMMKARGGGIGGSPVSTGHVTSGGAPGSQGRIATVQEDADLPPFAAAIEGGLALQQPGGFLEQARIGRFSMCFNDGANGVLRIGTPPPQEAHGSMGKLHWGLGLRGVSVGNVSALLKLCTPESMAKGQESPCGAIPDSGTTLIMAPQAHLTALYEGICDSWERCRRNHTALAQAAKAAGEAATEKLGFNPFHLSVPDKATTFQHLLEDCEAWMTDDTGLDELPPMHLHMQGSTGTSQTLALGGNAYVFVTETPKGTGKARLAEALKPAAAKKRRACQPAFGPMQYQTKANGPVWIIGTPLFYEFSVGYDLLSVPPSISFSSTRDSPCGACDKQAGLVSTAVSAPRSNSPRVLRGQPRLPSIDTSRPL